MINLEQSLQIVTQAMDIANKKGSFSLDDAATIHAALRVITEACGNQGAVKESDKTPVTKKKVTK
jgi:hypothetical protein